MRSLAGSPAPGESLYAVTGAVLDDLTRGDTGDVAFDPSVTPARLRRVTGTVVHRLPGRG